MVNKDLIKYMDDKYIYPTLCEKLVEQFSKQDAKDNFKYLLNSKDSTVEYEVKDKSLKKKPASKEKDKIINYYLQIIKILLLNKYIDLKEAGICIDIIRDYCGNLKEGNYNRVLNQMKFNVMVDIKSPIKNEFLDPDDESEDYSEFISNYWDIWEKYYSDILYGDMSKPNTNLIDKEESFLDLLKPLYIYIILGVIGIIVFLLILFA